MTQPRLLALPRELRDIIWEFACSNTEIFIPYKGRFSYCKANDSWIRTRPDDTGILKVNRQIYKEVIDLFYKSAVFCGGWPWADGFVTWYAQLPPAKQARVSRLRLLTDPVCPDQDVIVGRMSTTPRGKGGKAAHLYEVQKKAMSRWSVVNETLPKSGLSWRPRVEISMMDAQGRLVWVPAEMSSLCEHQNAALRAVRGRDIA